MVIPEKYSISLLEIKNMLPADCEHWFLLFVR